ncbi:transcription termination factor MTEF18, mitochondrial-like [Malania oleifera]|uniref:transcription termination factor MTEF18, mitochondrial-like n=1 Tax=Malania oleifera TaxID=397392 RepID=UPI0025ADAC8C|nr:transcription termination factor MTEF18, mitochondrial-like [Malania oleifera]
MTAVMGCCGFQSAIPVDYHVEGFTQKLVPIGRIERDPFIQLSFRRFHSSLISRRSVPEDAQHPSFTVSYLIDSCGLSPATALSVSKKVCFQNPDRPNSVLTFFRNHGFTQTHISKVVRTRPTLLLSNPEKTLLPKLEFFLSVGVSGADLAQIFSKNPDLFLCSVENRLIPYYDFLKNVVLLSDEEVVRAVKRSQRLFRTNLLKEIGPNISILREVGIPQSFISALVSRAPNILLFSPDKFDILFKEVINLGFSAKKSNFINAMSYFFAMSKSTRERKLEVYRRWGWSGDEIQSVFRRCPLCMTGSEKKIESVMDFLVNKMGWQSSAVARCPGVLCFSLENRIVPRCSVIKILQLKGFIKKNLSLGTVTVLSDKKFLAEFVTKYQNNVPELLNVYHGKIGLSRLGFGAGDICQLSIVTAEMNE